MKLKQLQNSLWLWVGALVLGAVLMAPAPARGVQTIIFTVSSTTLSTSGNTTINIFAETVGGTALSGSGFTLQIQVGDGGPWGNPNDTINNGTSNGVAPTPGRYDATGPVMDQSAGNVNPTGSPFNGDSLSSSVSKTDDPVGAGNGNGDTNPTQSQIYTLSATFGTAKSISAAAPVLLATINIDGSGLNPNASPAVYGSSYAVTLFATTEGSSSFGTGGHNNGPGGSGQALPSEALPALPEPASLGVIGILLPALMLRRRQRTV